MKEMFGFLPYPCLCLIFCFDRLTVAAKDLFRELSTAKQPVTPFRFLSTMRELYPQFGQTGQGGVPMQQDAEECYTQLMYALKEALKANGGDPLTDLMGVKLTTTLKCVESDESFEEKQVREMKDCLFGGLVSPQIPVSCMPSF